MLAIDIPVLSYEESIQMLAIDMFPEQCFILRLLLTRKTHRGPESQRPNCSLEKVCLPLEDGFDINLRHSLSHQTSNTYSK